MPTTTDIPNLPRAAMIKRGVIKRAFGASGTPNVAGYISGEDYNPKLDGKRALRVYDEMRRSDGQVQAVLLACKLPLKAATWEMQPPPNADHTDKAIAAFCQQAIFGDEAMEDPWPFVLSHLLLKLDFGVSLVEKVWRLDDDGRLRFRRLAPRLPQTVERWLVDDEGRLREVEQYAYRGGQGAFERLMIPGDSLMVTVNDREGDHWWGRSILRAAYLHWYLKNQLYRIDAIKHDRYGIGIPEAIIDDTQLEQKYTTDEIAAIDKMLEGLRGDEASYLRHYKSTEVKILTPDTSLTNDALIQSVEHHNGMIARSILAGFMSQGEQRHGSFGLGDRLADFFTMALETFARELCGDIKAQLVKPLCDVNFPMTGRPYPSPVASGVSDVDVEAIATNIQKLGPAYITPEDTLEDMLRKLSRLPPLPEPFRNRNRTPPAPARFGDDPDDPVLPKADQRSKKTPATPARRRALRLSSHVDALSGRVFGRQPTAFEEAVFALREVPQALDLYTQALVDRLTDVRRTQLTKIVDEVVRKDARESTGAFTDLRPEEIALPDVADLERAIKDAQRRVFAYGADQVRDELVRQGAALGLRAAVENVFALDASAGANKRAAKSALVTSAKVTAEKMGDAWYARILEVTMRERRTGLQGDALREAVHAALDDDVSTGVTRDAKAEVNEAFALGRSTEASSHKDQIDVVIYSALLDERTCSVCEALDGEEMAFGSDRYFETMPPNKDCEGNRGSPDACRCVHLFRFVGAT